MRFSSIVGLGGLLWAGAATTSLCRPSRASVSSSVSSLPSLSSSESASSVSSSASASSSAAPSQLPCGTNLLPGGANYDPGTSAIVSTSGFVSSSYPSTCYGQLLPNTCVKFEETAGDSGSFAISITAPTVAGNTYQFSMTAEVDHITSELVRCSANNDLILIFDVSIFVVDGSYSLIAVEFEAGVGDFTTMMYARPYAPLAPFMGRTERQDEHGSTDSRQEKSGFRNQLRGLFSRKVAQSKPEATVVTLPAKSSSDAPSTDRGGSPAEPALIGVEGLHSSPAAAVQPPDALQSVPEAQTPAASTTPPPQAAQLPASISPPAAATASSSPVTNPAPSKKSLWDQAYDKLGEKNPKLVKEYGNLLQNESQMADPTSNEGSSGSAPRRTQLDTVIKQGLRRLDESKAKHTIAGHEFDPVDQIATAAKVVLWAKEWIGSAVEVSPAASIAWAGVCLFLPLLTNPSTAAAASSSGFTNITARMRYYVELEPMVYRLGRNAGVSAALMAEADGHIVDLYQHILDFQISCVLRFYQSRAKTYVRDMVPSHDWKEAEAGIDRLEEIVRRDLGQINEFATREELEDSKQKLDDLDRTSKKSLGTLHELLSVSAQQLAVSKESLALQQAAALKVLSDEQKKCLQLFHLTSSEKDITYQWYKDRVEDRVGDTCLWLIEHPHFQEWLEKESAPLLISADPGCGKSVLAKYLINHELPRRQAATICYFFFKDKDQMTACQALCALLHQLFTQRPSLIKHAMSPFENKGQGLINSKSSLWSIFANAIRDVDDTIGPIIVVLDALDECDDAEFEFLIRHLKQQYRDEILESRTHLKLLMTSRPYTQIVSEFQELLSAFPNIRIPGENSSDRIREEIDIVIEHRVNKLDTIKNDAKHFLLERLRAVENRTYLWIYLVFDYLEEYLRKGLKKTRKGIGKAIETMPNSINEAYEQILEKSPNPGMAKKVLCIILAAQRPLTVTEMNFAVNVDEDVHLFSDLDLEDEEDFQSSLRSCCGLFISIYQDKVYFLHQTAREFLLADSSLPPMKSPEHNWLHSISISEAHTVLAEQCVYYLDIFNHDKSFSKDDYLEAIYELGFYDDDESDNSGDTESFSYAGSGSNESVSSRLDDHLAERKQEVIDRRMTHLYFLAYSAKQWATHLRQADIADDADLHRLVLAICEKSSESRFVWATVYDQDQTLHALHEENTYGLLTASCLGLVRTAQLLIDDGADVNKSIAQGWSPLLYAAMNGHDAVVRLLLKSGADVHLKKGSGWTPLTMAAEAGHEAVMWTLLANGAEIDMRDGTECTALWYAAKNGHKTIAQLLIEKGAFVDAGDYENNTPLMAASEAGHVDIVRLLILDGANVHARNNDGTTPLMRAATEGFVEVALLLVDNGARVDERDMNGWTPLMHASNNAEEAMVRFLLEMGADTNATADGSYAPILCALDVFSANIRQLLLDKVDDVNEVSNDGQTLLIRDAQEGYRALKFTQTLLERGADVNARDSYNRTALWHAVNFGSFEKVELLLGYGAAPDIQDKAGKTPMALAKEYGDTGMVELMEDYLAKS